MTELAPKASPAHSIARVLVIDDSAVARGLMTRWVEEDSDLTLIGSAVDGEQGLRKAEELKPDLIVLDVEMPKMDGREMCQCMRDEFPDRKPIVFVITARSELEFREWALDLPDCEFLHKPVSLRHMVERIGELLGPRE